MYHTKLNSYELLKDYILSGRSKQSRKLANNTIARFNGDNIDIVFWDTTIIEFLPDNTRILNSGGYKTYTTKERINEFLPDNIRLYQKGGLWYLYYIPIYNWDIEIPFSDNMIITPDGSIPSVPNISGDIKLRKNIKKYAKEFIKSLLSGNIESPNSGDCFFCYMVESSSQIPLGELNKDTSHLLNHIDEKYFVGSLLYRAVTVFRVSPIVYAGLGELWESSTIPDIWLQPIMSDQLYKSLVKYLFQQFNLPY